MSQLNNRTEQGHSREPDSRSIRQEILSLL
jgi:hypothetical protein